MTISFNSLGLSENRVNKLETLGFTSPTEIQSKAIPLVLEGHDILGQSQTGTGKTAAFALPIIELLEENLDDVSVLILAPTRELALQISEEINSQSAKIQ